MLRLVGDVIQRDGPQRADAPPEARDATDVAEPLAPLGARSVDFVEDAEEGRLCGGSK